MLLHDRTFLRFQHPRRVQRLPQSQKSVDQILAAEGQFAQMLRNQLLQNRLAFRRHLHQRAAHVLGVRFAPHQADTLCTVHQFHCAVVPQYHALSKIRDRRLLPLWHRRDDLHQLILLCADTASLRCHLAEVQKSTQLIAELRHAFESGRCILHFHLVTALVSEIVSQTDTTRIHIPSFLNPIH